VEGLRVIRSGLQPTDRIVIAGGQLAMPGMKVSTRPGRIEPVKAAAAPSIGQPMSGEATLVR
jgi:hypothetical protein